MRTYRTLVCLLEEPSSKEALKEILKNITGNNGNTSIKYIIFRGKQDLEKNIERKLKSWQAPNSRFLIMRDQDSGDCQVIKKQLQEKTKKAGKEQQTLIRIACRELESFYLGDLLAVEKGLGLSGLSNKQTKSQFRNPDNLENPSQKLKQITKQSYQKLQGSRAISPYLKIDGSNTSHSFKILVSGLRNFLAI
jgi:hypothetical protein